MRTKYAVKFPFGKVEVTVEGNDHIHFVAYGITVDGFSVNHLNVDFFRQLDGSFDIFNPKTPFIQRKDHFGITDGIPREVKEVVFISLFKYVNDFVKTKQFEEIVKFVVKKDKKHLQEVVALIKRAEKLGMQLGQDNYGQHILYTNVMTDKNDKDVWFDGGESIEASDTFKSEHEVPESKFYWKIDENLIAGFDTFEEAKRWLDESPMNVTITHGDDTYQIPKELISIIPAEDL